MMPMMDIWPVWVRVSLNMVLMWMAVHLMGLQAWVVVIMMTVIVSVLMVVKHRCVLMQVVVTTEENHKNRSDQQSASDPLQPQHGFTQQRCRQHHAKEGRSAEDHLRTRCAHRLGRADVECHAKTIGKATDNERAKPGQTRNAWFDGQAESEVDGSGDQPFPEGDVFGADGINSRGEVVIDAPSQCGACYTSESEPTRPSSLVTKEDAGEYYPNVASPGPATDVFAEDQGSEDGGGHGLQVKPHGHRRGKRMAQAEEQQNRADNPAEKHRAPQPTAIEGIGRKDRAPPVPSPDDDRADE